MRMFISYLSLFSLLLSMLSWDRVSQQLPTFPMHLLQTLHALKVRITLPSSSTLTDLWGLEQHIRLWYRLIFSRCSTSTTHRSSLLFWSYRTTAFVLLCKVHSKSRSFVVILTFSCTDFSVDNVVVVSLNYPDDSSGPEVSHIFNAFCAFPAGLQCNEHHSGSGYLNVPNICLTYLPAHFE